MFKINFCELSKIPMMKLWPYFFFRSDSKIVNYEKSENIKLSVLKKRWAWCFGICYNWPFLITLKKLGFYLFLDFWGKLNFSKSALFWREMLILTNFGLDIDVYIVNLIIFIKKYFTDFFRINFNELLKCTTILITNIL